MIVVFPPTGSWPWKGRWAPRLRSSQSRATFTFYVYVLSKWCYLYMTYTFDNIVSNSQLLILLLLTSPVTYFHNSVASSHVILLPMPSTWTDKPVNPKLISCYACYWTKQSTDMACAVDWLLHDWPIDALSSNPSE